MSTPSAAATIAAEDLIALFRRLRRRMRSLPAGDLTPSQTAVLLRLDNASAATTTALALAEGVRSQSMTATLAALERLGLIARRPDPEDGRRQLITLSPAGRARVGRDRERRHEWLARSLHQQLTPAQLRTVNEALALLAEVVAE